MKHLRKNYINVMCIVNVLIIVLFSILHTFGKIPDLYLSYSFIPLGIINIIISIYYRIYNRIKLRSVDYASFFIIAYGIISTIFAFDQHTALFGFTFRYEGLLSLIYYLTLFQLTSFINKDKNYIIYLLIIFGSIYGFVGLLQKIGIAGSLNKIRNSTFYALGFTSNPNFLSAFLLMCVTYSIGFFVKEKDILTKIVFGISIYIMFVGMLTTDTVSGMIGLFVSLVILFIDCIKNHKLKSFGIVILILISSLVLMSSAKLTILDSKIVKTLNESSEMAATGEIKDSYGTKRGFVWKAVIKEVPKHWAYGIGIDNVYYIYNGYPIIHNFITAYDKVHNEYLQILITEGIFALGAYLAFYFMVLKKGIKNVKKNNKIYLLLPVVGYLVQAFFNISVIEVAPIFYLSMGLLYSKE